MAPLPLELAVFYVADALLAQSLGAARIELNAPGSYPAGGLTPPLSALAALAAPSLRIPLRVMIRPRGPPADGPDFIYTAAELDAMRAAISAIKAAGVMDVARGDGFVFGVLTQDSGKLAVDAATCAELVALAAPVPCVFHRAFDLVAADGVAVLAQCGFAGLLTAGGAVGNYLDNLDNLARICEQARTGRRIEVVAGGGVRHHNVAGPAAAALGKFGDAGPRVWVHSAALRADGAGMDGDEVRRLLAALAE